MRLAYQQKIGTRLGFGFAIVVGLTLLLGVIALIEMNSMANLTRDLYNHPLTVSNAIRDIRGNVLAMHRSIKDVVLAQTDKQRQEAVSQVDQEEQKALESFDILYERFLGDKADIDAAHQAFVDWKSILSEVISLIQGGQKDDTVQITQDKGTDQVLHINGHLQVISDFASQKATAFFNSAQEAQRRHLWTLSGLVLLITVAGILGGLLITRSITGPLHYVMKQMGEVAGGNLNHKINLNSDDEIGQLAQTFDQMTASLKKITASRNEFDAANQQLRASEQQLRAQEQQLRASEQQLRAANQQLIASEQHRESIISTVPGVVYRLHRDVNGDFSIPYMSQQAENIIGHPQNMLTHSDWFFGIIHSDDVEDFHLSIRDSAQTLSLCTVEFRVFDTNGRLRWLKSISTPRRLADGSTVWNGIMIDITDRKQDEARMQESEQRYRIVADNTYNWEFWLDPGNRYVYISPSCQRITGYTAEEFKIDPDLFKAIVHPDDRRSYQIHSMDVSTRKSAGNIQFRIIHKDGQIRWIEQVCQSLFDKDGKWLGIRGSSRDITQRKQAQEQLSYIKAAVDATCDAIGMMTVDGHHFYQNKAFDRLFGYTLEEISRLHPAKLYANKDDARSVFETIMAGKSWHGQVEMIDRNGRHFPVSIRADAIKDKNGKITGLIGVHTDITERNTLELTQQVLEAVAEGVGDRDG
jgi:PAS domain S-box-containing protein